MQGFFITGTDTGVGKTFVGAGIASRIKDKGIDVGVMKPVHTGCKFWKGRLVPEDSQVLIQASGVDDDMALVSPYCFREPAAPYVAALKKGIKIDMERITRCFEILSSRHESMIVEGIGGVLVPLTDKLLVIDLIKEIKLPVVVITKGELGTINHTLLTIKYLTEQHINIKGVVINYSREMSGGLAGKSVKGVLKVFSKVPVLGVNPYFSKSDMMKKRDRYYFSKLSNSLFNII